MLTTTDTRRHSHQARRQHAATQATQHGWTHTALPLTATLGERLKAKAEADDEQGDMADAAMRLLSA